MHFVNLHCTAASMSINIYCIYGMYVVFQKRYRTESEGF